MLRSDLKINRRVKKNLFWVEIARKKEAACPPSQGGGGFVLAVAVGGRGAFVKVPRSENFLF